MRKKHCRHGVETESFVLNFQERVTHASVKNCQLVSDLDRKWQVWVVMC